MRHATMSSHTNQQTRLMAVPSAPLPSSTPSPKSQSQRIEALNQEYQRLQVRMEEIRKEVQEIFGTLNQIGPGDSMLASGRRQQVEKPRPVEDKLVISAGRAIVKAMKQKKTPDQCKQEAIQAATLVAKKYNLSELPARVLTQIDKKIKSRFNL